MSFQIRIVPEELRAAAERERNIQKAVEEIKAKMTNQVRSLDQAWDGGASRAAISNLESIKNRMDDLLQGLYSGARMLDGVANAFEALDDNPEAPESPFVALPHFSIRDFVIGCPKPDFSIVLNGRLRIIPERVREIGRECKQIAEMSLKEASALQASLNTLAENWEGNSFRKYADESEDLMAAFKNMANSMDEFGDKITLIANRYEDLDRRF